MNVSQIRTFKIQRAEELSRLHRFLQRKLKNATQALEPLRVAANELMKEAELKDGNPTWGYNITNLVLPLGVNKHIEPSGIKTLRVRIDCNVKCNVEHWNQLEDPFISYNFAAIIFGEKDNINYSICWHVDKDCGDDSDEHHPLYHLQYSNGCSLLGKSNTNFNWGHLVYLDSPRIVHYPMDIVLGIGFYLTNFHYKGIFEEYLKDPLFSRLYNQAKNKILKPYFLNIASHWDCDDSQLQWKSSGLLCPHLC